MSEVLGSLHIPPVLRRCVFVGVEEHDHHTSLVFISNDPAVEGGIVRVVVRFKGKPLYVYTMYDPKSETLVHYEGVSGDPERDKHTEVKGTG